MRSSNYTRTSYLMALFAERYTSHRLVGQCTQTEPKLRQIPRFIATYPRFSAGISLNSLVHSNPAVPPSVTVTDFPVRVPQFFSELLTWTG